MSDKKSNLKAVLDWRKLIYILPLAVLWAIPLSRAISFISYAQSIFTEEQSINASNDVNYGVALVISYALCFTMDFTLCILVAKRSLILLFLLLSLPFWVVIEVIRFKPEEVIILIPSMNPMWPLMWNMIPLVIALSIVGIQKLKTNSLGNARTN